jgi:hypothetical protein
MPELVLGRQGILLGILTMAGYDMQVGSMLLCNLVCSFHILFVAAGYRIHAAKQDDSALGFGSFGDYAFETFHCWSP